MNNIEIYDNYAEIIMMNKDRNESGRTKISLHRIEQCSNYRWWMHHDGYAYCKVKVNNGWRNMQLSRFLMETPDGLICDHINHNTLDNRDENLRNCTVQQNAFNMKNMNGNTIKGVRKVCNKWYARLKYNGKEISRGGFNTEEQARDARREMEVQYFGEYAKI